MSGDQVRIHNLPQQSNFYSFTKGHTKCSAENKFCYVPGEIPSCSEKKCSLKKHLELCRFDGWSLIFMMPFHTVLVRSSSGVWSVYFRVICALSTYFCLCQNPLAISQLASPQMTHCSWLSFLLYTLHFSIPASKQKIFTMRRYSRSRKLLKRTAKQQPRQLRWPT